MILDQLSIPEGVELDKSMTLEQAREVLAAATPVLLIDDGDDYNDPVPSPVPEGERFPPITGRDYAPEPVYEDTGDNYQRPEFILLSDAQRKTAERFLAEGLTAEEAVEETLINEFPSRRQQDIRDAMATGTPFWQAIEDAREADWDDACDAENERRMNFA